MYQHNNIIVLLIEHAKVDNIVIDLRKGNRTKTKTKTKQNRPHWQKKARNQNNGTHWVGNEATNSLKQLDDELIVYNYGVLAKNDIVQRQTNEWTDLPMDN